MDYVKLLEKPDLMTMMCNSIVQNNKIRLYDGCATTTAPTTTTVPTMTTAPAGASPRVECACLSVAHVS